MQHPLLLTLILGSILFPAFLIIVSVLFALLLGGLPNGIQFQTTTDLAFLQILWQGNPWETVKLVLVDKPLMVIEHLDHGTGVQVWGMFYYAGAVLMYLLVSTFTALHWKGLRNSTTRQRVLFGVGVAAALIGVTYLQRAACCTSGPGWALETWLRAEAYTPNPGAMNWALVYQRMQPWWPVVQTGMLVGGIAMLYLWYLGARKTVVRH